MNEYSQTNTTSELLSLIQRHNDEIAERRLQIAALSRTVNSRSAVLSLPNELLADIFIYYRDGCVLIEKGGNRMPKGRWWWLVPTHVCHRWKVVALATPFLWNYIDGDVFSRHSFLSMALARCNSSVPLDISIEYALFGATTHVCPNQWTKEEIGALGLILNESHRIRDLYLKMPRSLFQTQFTRRTVLRPYTQLRRIHVEALSPSGSGVPVHALFKTLPVSLQSVQLSGIILRDDTMLSFPPNITNLEIDFFESRILSSFEFTEIYNLLARLQQLECLTLNRLTLKVREDVGPEYAGRATIHLSQLRELNFLQVNWNVISLLQLLSFPPNIDATIKVIFSSDDPDPPDNLPSILSKFGFSPAPEKRSDIYSALVCQPDSNCFFFETSTEAPITSWPRRFHFSLGMVPGESFEDSEYDGSPWFHFVTSIGATIFPFLEQLLVDGVFSVISRQTFVFMFDNAENLQTIQTTNAGLKNNENSHLLAALAPGIDGTVRLRNLQTITLIDEPLAVDAGAVVFQPDRVFFVPLRDIAYVLRARAKVDKGYKLKKFIIPCTAPLDGWAGNMVKMLSAYAEQVILI